MEKLNTKDFKTIRSLFKTNQKTLLKITRQFLKAHYKKVITSKDYVIAIGDIPVGITSHLDTVFKAPPEDIFYDSEQNVMWSPQGLGADDRAGVFSILHLIQEGYRPTVIFTTDEEIGSLGAEQLIKDYPEPVAEMKYIIEMDRRGSNDCVFYDCDNTSFNNYVETFGFVTNFGSFSDISVLCPAWGIAGVNLSVGYYNEHNFIETLYIGQMISTIKKVKKMFENLEEAPFYEYIPSKFSYFGENCWNNWFSYSPQEDDETFTYSPALGIASNINEDTYWVCCTCCNNKYAEYNTIPVVEEDSVTRYYCVDCFTKNSDKMGFCNECKTFFKLKDKDQDSSICPNCEKKGEMLNGKRKRSKRSCN